MNYKRRGQILAATGQAIAVLLAVGAIGFTVGWVVHPDVEDETNPSQVTDQKPDVRYPLTDDERRAVELVVMAEAEGEGYDGQRLVAQCILNTAEAQGVSPIEVVFAQGQYAAPTEYASESVQEAVSAVFDDGDMVVQECIRWFYAPQYGVSEWHESKEFVVEYGGHRFFMEG